MNYQYHWDFAFLAHNVPLLLWGLANTLRLAVVAAVCGMAIGLLVAAARLGPWRLLSACATAYVELFRNIPGIVQLFWFYYTIPVLTGWQSSPWIASTVSLSLYSGGYFAEIYRAGIQSVERGQWEGARALGFGYLGALRDVVLPQAVQRMIPAFTNRILEVIKTTTLASAIAFGELLYTAKQISDDALRPMEAYTAVAVIFTAILLPLTYVALRLERRAGRGRGLAR